MRQQHHISVAAVDDSDSANSTVLLDDDYDVGSVAGGTKQRMKMVEYEELWVWWCIFIFTHHIELCLGRGENFGYFCKWLSLCMCWSYRHNSHYWGCGIFCVILALCSSFTVWLCVFIPSFITQPPHPPLFFNLCFVLTLIFIKFNYRFMFAPLFLYISLWLFILVFVIGIVADGFVVAVVVVVVIVVAVAVAG